MWDEHGFYKTLELRSDLACFGLKVTWQTIVYSRCEIIRKVDWISLPVSFCQNCVFFDKLVVAIDMEDIVRYFDPDFLTYVLVRDGIALLLHLDVAVRMNRCLFPVPLTACRII